MTPTPRTDAETYDCEYRGDMGSIFAADKGKPDPQGDHVSADFARTLEIELNDASTKNKVCQCSLATQLVGDGCERCNPEKAQEIKEQNYEDRIHDLEREHAELLEALEKCLYIIGAPPTDECETVWRTDDELKTAYDAAVAAIAKTKGKP